MCHTTKNECERNQIVFLLSMLIQFYGYSWGKLNPWCSFIRPEASLFASHADIDATEAVVPKKGGIHLCHGSTIDKLLNINKSYFRVLFIWGHVASTVFHFPILQMNISFLSVGEVGSAGRQCACVIISPPVAGGFWHLPRSSRASVFHCRELSNENIEIYFGLGEIKWASFSDNFFISKMNALMDIWV